MGKLKDFKDAFSAAGAEEEEDGGKGIIGTVFGGVISAQKSAIAANHASDMLDDRKIGIIAKAVDTVVDTVGDVANIASFGVTRRITNVVHKTIGDHDKVLDYKGLKAAKKEDGGLTIKERAGILAGEMPEQDVPSPEPELGG